MLYQTADMYKYSHILMYPDDVEYMYAYCAARNADVFFLGLKYMINTYLKDTRIPERTMTMIDKRFPKENDPALVFNIMWKELDRVSQGGTRLPLRIVSAPEGTWVPKGQACFTVENTDPRFAWLVPFVETLLLKVWYPSTIATRQSRLRTDLEAIWSQYAYDLRAGYMVHDFGYRGASSTESALLAGAAHLLSFYGSDTTGADDFLYHEMKMARQYLSTVPASEHSVMLMGTDEYMIRRILDAYPKGTVSIVLDTYDYKTCVEEIICGSLYQKINERNGKLVLRPDSGDPEELIPWTLDILDRNFGTTVSPTGLKRLSNAVGILWGDGVNHDKIKSLYLKTIIGNGYCPSNVVFGMGGALHNGVDRDTLGFTYKVSEYRTKDGVVHPVSKHAVGKESHRGRIEVPNGVDVYTNGDTPWKDLR